MRHRPPQTCDLGRERTEDGEFGPPGPQGGVRGLALVQGVIRQFSRQDLQVVLAQLLHTQHSVPGPSCTHTHTHQKFKQCKYNMRGCAKSVVKESDLK